MGFTPHRTCPHCGVGQGFRRMWLLNSTWARWDCRACGTRLGFSSRRRLVIALVQSPFLALFLLSAFNHEWFWALISAGLCHLVWRFDGLVLADPEGHISLADRA